MRAGWRVCARASEPGEVRQACIQALARQPPVSSAPAGFTLTFYRQKGLPPPPAYRARRSAAGPAGAAGGPAARSELGSDDEEGSGSEDEDEEGVELFDAELAAYLETEDAFSDSDSEGEEEEDEAAGSSGGGGGARRRGGGKPPPPEFVVLQ